MGNNNSNSRKFQVDGETELRRRKLRALTAQNEYLQRENQNLQWNLRKNQAQAEEFTNRVYAGAAIGAAIITVAGLLGARQYQKATKTIVYLKEQAAVAKRTATADVENAKRYGVQGIANGLIETADNLSRATGSIKDSDKCYSCSLMEGVKMTEEQFVKTLNENGIDIVDPSSNEKFDPEFHEAVSVKETDDVSKGNVVEVMQPGWSLNKERVLRPARVVVSKGPSKS